MSDWQHKLGYELFLQYTFQFITVTFICQSACNEENVNIKSANQNFFKRSTKKDKKRKTQEGDILKDKTVK
jgi:hypothetical protein